VTTTVRLDKAPQKAPRRLLGRLVATQRTYPVLQCVAVVALFAFGSYTIADFSSGPSVRSMLVSASFLGLAGLGQTLVVLIGGLDLSAPALIALGAILTCELAGARSWPVPLVLLTIVASAAALGATSGYLSHRFAVQPLVVTLGLATAVSGGLLGWTDGAPQGTAPAWIGRLSWPTSTTFGIAVPPVVAILVAVAALMALVLHRTVTGRRFYLVGANPVAADLVLINTRRVWVCTFAVSAVSAALFGVLLAGFSGSSSVTMGDPYLFQGLAAVIVGGTAFGARGDYSRTILGALLITVLSTVLLGHGLTAAQQQTIFGILILVVVTGYARDSRLRDRV
jgi:ribose transport system permease protein